MGGKELNNSKIMLFALMGLLELPRKVFTLGNGNMASTIDLIKTTFEISGEVILQKYDPEREEFIDVTHNETIADKCTRGRMALHFLQENLRY